MRHLERTATANAVQASEELGLLNGRVASLERANAELRAIRGQALDEARSVGAAAYEGSLDLLERQLEAQRATSADREAVAAERELPQASELLAYFWREKLRQIADKTALAQIELSKANHRWREICPQLGEAVPQTVGERAAGAAHEAHKTP